MNYVPFESSETAWLMLYFDFCSNIEITKGKCFVHYKVYSPYEELQMPDIHRYIYKLAYQSAGGFKGWLSGREKDDFIRVHRIAKSVFSLSEDELLSKMILDNIV